MTSPHESREAFRPAALVPAYRCASAVGGVVRGLLAHLPQVLVVDDGSGDGTPGAALAAGGRVLSRRENGGKGCAIRDGLADLFGRDVTHVAFVDADGQHDPDDLPALLDGLPTLAPVVHLSLQGTDAQLHAPNGSDAVMRYLGGAGSQYLLTLSTKRSQFAGGQDLAPGTYHLWVEAPGLPSTEAWFDLR